ncbi:MAG TPA: leucyl aminopeptidase, partial [Opitutales bacterium]|nr:leucyl aminopeptidase [Opitutales bacterium]
MRWESLANGSRLLLVHCGEQKDYAPEHLTSLITDMLQVLLKQGIRSVTLSLPQLTQQSPDWQLEQMLIQVDAITYQFLDFKQDQSNQHLLESVDFYLPDANRSSIESAKHIAAGVKLARTLANLPSNICTPTYLAAEALALTQEYPSLTTTVLNQADLETLGMGAFLAVAKGSIEPPKLIQIQYHGQKNKSAPIVLAGKGITFDSGGISLKPPSGLEEMKYDMAGAASVLGTLKACAALNLPIHVIGLLACAENMPSGHATRPGDIVKTMSGKTVEIANTDAEGRLVLADTLTYAEQFKPRFVIDIATLTGAVIVALGHEYSGLMTRDEALAE